jgi:uncharacterized protein
MKHALKLVLKQYKLSPTGTHGISHWARVLEIGRYLAEITGANLKVVEHFAIFHDSCRQSEYSDPDHGPRSVKLLDSIQDKLDLNYREFQLLSAACRTHNGISPDRHGHGYDVTLETCWDSDRLDIGRVGDVYHVPDKNKLFTEPAKDSKVIEGFLEKSYVEFLPKLVKEEWNIDFKPTAYENRCLADRHKDLKSFMTMAKRFL